MAVTNDNGFNEEDVLLIKAGIDFSTLNKDTKKMVKQLNKAAADGEIDIEVATDSIKEIEKLEKEIEGLKKQLKSLGQNKLSRTTFTTYQKEITERVDIIENKLNGLSNALVEVTSEFGKVGSDFDLTKVIETCNKATDAIHDAADAAKELDNITGSSATIDDTRFLDIEKRLKKLKQSQNEYKKLDNDIDYIGIVPKKNQDSVSLKQALEYFQTTIIQYETANKLLTQYSAELKELQKAKQSGEDIAGSLFLLNEINTSYAATEVSKYITILDRLKDYIYSFSEEERNKIDLSFFTKRTDEENIQIFSKQLRDIKDSGLDAAETIKFFNDIIDDFHKNLKVSDRIPFIGETAENLDSLIPGLDGLDKALEMVSKREDKANARIEKANKAISEQKTLLDLIQNKTIPIEIKTDTEKLKVELNNQVDALQDELKKKSIMMPIKVYVESANIKDALNTVEEIDTSVSDRAISDSRREIAKSEKAAEKAGEKAKEVVMDLAKVTDKGAASVLKVVEMALNKFVNDVKSKVGSIFETPFDVKIKLDEESEKTVKQSLSSEITLNQEDLAKNIETANAAAKALADNLKEVLGLIEQTNDESGLLNTFYTKSGRRRSENKIIEDLVGKLNEYSKAARKIQEECQSIFTKHPILLRLELADGETGKILKKIDEANFAHSLQSALTRAETIAEGIVEVLKPLNGLEIRVSQTGKAAVNLAEMQNQVSTALAGISALSKALSEIKTALGAVGKDDKGVKQVSVDFEQVTNKISEVIRVSTTLSNKLHDDLVTIQNQFKELGEVLDNIFNNPEKQLHTITDEVHNLDLSQIYTNLAEIWDMLERIFNVLQGVNGALRTTDSFQLGSKWNEVATAFRNIANANDDIDLRKQKKDVAELLKLYQEYVALGGTNDFSMLTNNQKTLTKLQTQADNIIGGRSVVDNEKLRETKDVLRTIDTILSSLTGSLQTINGLDNVAKVFSALNIKKDNMDKILALPGQLKQISDQLRELDNMHYKGFIAQLSNITKQTEGLKALAEILKSSQSQIQQTLELASGGKANREALKEQMKIVTQLESAYKKAWNSGITETKQPEQYAAALRAIEINLKEIQSINEKEIIHASDIVTLKQLIEETKDWFVQLEQVKYAAGEINSEFEAQAKIFKKSETLYNKLFNGGAGEVGKSDEYITNLRSMGAIIEKINDIQTKPFKTQEDIDIIKQANNELAEYAQAINRITEEVKQEAKAEAEAQKIANKDLQQKIKDALRTANSYERNYSRSWGFGKIEENYTNDYGARLVQIRNILNEIQVIKDKGISNITEADLTLINQYNEALEKEFVELVKINQTAKETQITNLQDKMSQYILKNSRLTDGMVSQLVEYIKELDNVDDITKKRLNEIATGFNRVQYAAKLAGKEGTGFLDAIRNKLKYGWAQSIAMFFSFYDIIRYIREISSTVTELNSSLIELSKVSNTSIGNLYNQFSDFAAIAKETGGTINDIIEATANWSRNGYGLSESKELARLSSIFQNIGDGMSADQANEYLVSTLKGFNLEAKDAITILDTLNNVANNSASSVADIGEALERSSSAFGASNTNLTESVALLVKANEVLQNPENVGTAFKSMSARLRAADTEIEDLEDGFTMTTSKLRNMVQALTGFDIQETEDSYKSIYQILLGIGKEWNNLTDIQQASLAEELFGKRNSQVGFAILNNIERLEEIYSLAEDSAGSAYAEQSRYLEGIQYRIDQFQASVQNLANTFMSSDFLKGAISTGTTFVNILEAIVKNLGAIPALIGAISTAVGAKWNIFSGLFDVNVGGRGNVLPITTKTDLAALAAGGNSGIKALIQEYNNLGTAISQTGLKQEAFIAKVAEGNQDLAKYFSSIEKGGVASFRKYSIALTTASIKTAALRAATMALQGVIFSFVVAGITKVFDKLIVTSEELTEAADNAREKIQSLQDTFKAQQKVVSDYGKRYAELAQGVNQTTGANFSLSDSNYQEFLDISNQLAEVFPNLVKGYDSNGNAILKLDGNAKSIVGTLKELLATEQKFTNDSILSKFAEIWPDTINSVGNDKSSINVLKQTVDYLTEDYDEIKDILETVKTIDSGMYTAIDNYNDEIVEILDAFYGKDAQKYYSKEGFLPAQFLNVDKWAPEVKEKILALYQKPLLDAQEDLHLAFEQFSTDYKGNLSYISLWLDNQLSDSEKYSDEFKSGIQTIIANALDDPFSDIYTTDVFNYIKNNILAPFQKEGNQDLKTKFEIAIEAETKFNNNEISVDEYEKKLSDFLRLVNNLDDEEYGDFKKKISVLWDFEFDKNGIIKNPDKQRLQKSLYGILNAQGIMGDEQQYLEAKNAIDDFINGLNQEDLQLMADVDLDKEESLKNIIRSYDDIVEEMSKYEQGNVKLTNRPLVSGVQMRAAGWDVPWDSTATVYSMGENIYDANGKEIEITFTPILPNGDVLTEQQLNDYIGNVLNGAQDVLEADKEENGGLGIVMKVDTDITPQKQEQLDKFGVKVHELQEEFYMSDYAANRFSEALSGILTKQKQSEGSTFEIGFDEKDVNAATAGIKEIQSVFQTLYDANSEGKKGSSLAFLMSDMDTLKSKLVDANGNVKVSEETWNEFFNTMTDGTHTYEEMKNSLNTLLTEYATATIELKNFDEENAKQLSTQLQLAGVTKESADTFVEAMTARAQAVQQAENASFDLKSATYEDIAAFIDEANMSALAGQQLYVYALEKKLAAGLTINTVADCEELYNLAEAAQVSGEKLLRLSELQGDLASAQKAYEDAVKSGDSDAEASAIKQLQNVKRTLNTFVKEDIAKAAKVITTPKFDFDPTKLKSSSSGGKEEDAWKKAYEKELAALDHLHEMELISDIQYYEEREKLNDKYFKDREKYTEDYNKNLEEIYKGFQSAYKSYVDDMSDYWKKSLDAGLINFNQYCSNMKNMLEDLHNAGKISDETYYSGLSDYYGTVIDGYDKAINAAQRVIKKRIDQLNKEKEALEKTYEDKKDIIQAQIDEINEAIDSRNDQIEAINKQIDAINDEIDIYQKEIDKLNEANEERKAALSMQKALYNLSRAENQRKDLVYKSEVGFIYEANAQDIKEAQDEIADLEHEQVVRNLEKTISSLQDSIEVLEDNIESLEDEIEGLEDNIESLEDEIQKLEKELETLTEKYDEQISSLEEYSDAIGECANKWTEAQEDMVAASIWGSDYQNKILSEDKELLQNFEKMYVQAQKNQAQAALDAANEKARAYNKEIEAINALKDAESSSSKTSGVSLLDTTNQVSTKTTTDNSKNNKKTATETPTKAVRYAYKRGNEIVYVYGSGTKNAAPGFQEIAEDGDEIVRDNYGNAYLAKGHQLHHFEGGETVYNPSETKELLSGKYIPIDSILPNYASMLSRVMSGNISPTTMNMGNNVISSKNGATPMKVDNSIHVEIGDIHVTEVDNVTQIAKAIKNQLPNALLQELNRK